MVRLNVGLTNDQAVYFLVSFHITNADLIRGLVVNFSSVLRSITLCSIITVRP